MSTHAHDGRDLSVFLLGLDALTLRVVSALDARGITSLLMKGPVTSRWLYDDPREHVYTDVDLLVSPADEEQASSVLSGLGLRDFHASVLGIHRPTEERAWTSEAGVVDLHTGLSGIPSTRSQQAWEVFRAGSEPFLLHGRRLSVLSPGARALQLALHAAQRRSGAKALRDLHGGLDRLPRETWVDAARLASELGATAGFESGLRRDARGPVLLRDLGVPPSATTTSVLYERGCLPEALAVARLGALSGRDRWRTVRRWLSLDADEVSRGQLARSRCVVASRMPRALLQWGLARRRARVLTSR